MGEDRQIEAWRLFWAKTTRQAPDGLPTRPLWAHLIDVANAAELLWELYLPATFRRKLTAAVHMDEDDAGRLLSLWIGLHDIGKAIPSFQQLHEPSWEMLSKAGMGISVASDQRLHHGHATIPILWRWLEQQQLSGPAFRLLQRAAMYVGYHHGRLCTFSTASSSSLALGDRRWQDARQSLVNTVVEVWGMPALNDVDMPHRSWPAWLLGFGGWVTLADWVGSMAEYFPSNVAADDNVQAYMDASRRGAMKAVEATGLARTANLHARSFGELFGFSHPRPLQAHMQDLDVDGGPALTIIEASTGVGKTEAALWLAARQQGRQSRGGIYVAMPTQATSNGLFRRFERFLQEAHAAGDAANVVLLHGNADLHPDRQRLLNQTPSFSDIADTDGRAVSAETYTAAWFLPKKRGLLAPYGIGTVDQAFLGVLFSKHFFLRLFGLAGKTVIFDEVHAYDTYMNVLFERLLGWLRALGANVVILSATLPSATRRRLIEAWEDGVVRGDIQYPSVVHVTRAGTRIDDEFDVDPDEKSTHIECIRPEIENVVDQVIDALVKGACVAIIVNRVDRAQELYRRIEHRQQETELRDNDLYLLHSRFPIGRRSKIEDAVMERFGPNRPHRRGVLVSTQIVEQSLDLDFDLMLTDLAPIDLLLQREGRLHRHERTRPAGFDEPRLRVLCPPAPDDAFPDVDSVGIVYDRLMLYMTWLVLQKGKTWVLPRDYRALIDSVYNADAPSDLTPYQRDQWKEARWLFDKRTREEAAEAKKRCIPTPDTLRELVNLPHLNLADEDEEDVHPDLLALTRLGGPSVEAVCLHRDNHGELYLDAARKIAAPTDIPLSMNDVRSLLSVSVRISHRTLAPFLIKKDQPSWWTEIADMTPALYRHRLLVFDQARWNESGKYQLVFDHSLGVIIVNADAPISEPKVQRA